MTILSQPVYRGFGPTLAAEYLAKKHEIEVSRETVRQWMIGGQAVAGAASSKVEKVHDWRPRRSRFGELVQWDTSEHDWLEGRGEKLYLINMIDDATSRLFARFVRQRFDGREHETAGELPGEVRAAAGVLHRQGEPVSDGGEAQTGRAGSGERPRWRCRRRRSAGRCRNWGSPGLRRISPQAKGRVERNFGRRRIGW